VVTKVASLAPSKRQTKMGHMVKWPGTKKCPGNITLEGTPPEECECAVANTLQL